MTKLILVLTLLVAPFAFAQEGAWVSAVNTNEVTRETYTAFITRAIRTSDDTEVQLICRWEDAKRKDESCGFLLVEEHIIDYSTYNVLLKKRQPPVAHVDLRFGDGKLQQKRILSSSGAYHVGWMDRRVPRNLIKALIKGEEIAVSIPIYGQVDITAVFSAAGFKELYDAQLVGKP